MGPVHFFCCDFQRPALFDHAHFSQGATFTGCTFHVEASFGWTRFDGPAYFWRTHFLTGASFAQCVVQAPQERFEGYVNPGEANFSWALFGGDANFTRAHFLDRAWFWRTVFRGTATFDQARFGAAATFRGAAHEVCVAAPDFPSRTLFDALCEAGLLVADQETKPPRFWHFRDTTGEALDAAMIEAGFEERDRRAAEAVWRGYAHPMFTDGAMTGVAFDQPAAVAVSQVNLGRCFLVGTDVEPLTLEDIAWAEQPRRPLGRRMAVRDEEAARTPEALAATGRLYTRLRRNAERGERQAEAGDFYYGEMEMRRRGQPPLLRTISLLASTSTSAAMASAPASRSACCSAGSSSCFPWPTSCWAPSTASRAPSCTRWRSPPSSAPRARWRSTSQDASSRASSACLCLCRRRCSRSRCADASRGARAASEAA
jgi:hypothetical protein